MKKTKKAYEIVIDSIKEQIMNQELVLGQGLPPEREISEKLGVSRNGSCLKQTRRRKLYIRKF